MELYQSIDIEKELLLDVMYTHSAIVSGDSEWPIKSVSEIIEPEHTFGQNGLSDFILNYNLSKAERVLLACAMAPLTYPTLLYSFWITDNSYKLISSKISKVYFPTSETVLTILSDNSETKKLIHQHLFEPDNVLFRNGFLELIELPNYHRLLRVSRKFIELVCPALLESMPVNAKHPLFNINFELYLSNSTMKRMEIETYDESVIDENLEGSFIEVSSNGILLKKEDFTTVEIPFENIRFISSITDLKND